MNYLAHAFLSNNQTQLLVGNFIADHVRGNDLPAYAPGIIDGVMLHRRIDSFTDAHPLFRKAKRLFYEGYERHSGILVDIYFDHLLAANFPEFSKEDLHDFSERIYNVYREHQHLIPLSSSRFLDYLTSNKIYQSYASEQGIERVLYHLSQRIRHGVRLDGSIVLFLKHRDELEQFFREFFNDACREFSIQK